MVTCPTFHCSIPKISVKHVKLKTLNFVYWFAIVILEGQIVPQVGMVIVT